MLQLENVNDYEWRRLVEALDKGVAEATRGYLAQLQARRVSIRTDNWEDELDELRLAREPDYDRSGLPLVYALKYMPRRVISVLGSLLALGLDRYPSTVLDVGSGTGATALALALLDAPRHIKLTGIEPSPGMIAFASSSRFLGRVSALYTEGSISDGTLERLPLGGYDLMVFSATFPYHFSEWERLLDILGRHEDSGDTMILAVEPDAKASILASFARRLRARGWPTISFTSDDLPDTLKRDDIPLKATMNIWERIGSPGSVPPRTWWSPPRDRYLIANPKPSWPLLGETRFEGVRIGLGGDERTVVIA